MLHMNINVSFISADQRCPGSSKACDQHLEDVPDFTWSIVAAGDLREERNGKSGKKSGSPQGWEEGKSEGITSPPIAGEFHFSNKLSQNWPQNFDILCSVELWKGSMVYYFFFFKVIVNLWVAKVGHRVNCLNNYVNAVKKKKKTGTETVSAQLLQHKKSEISHQRSHPARHVCLILHFVKFVFVYFFFFNIRSWI